MPKKDTCPEDTSAPRKLRAAIYPRVSSVGQSSEDRYSLGTQEDACRAWCDERDIEVTHVFREVYSGEYLWERPDLTRLRELVRRHEIDMVICHEIDRYSRDPVHLGVLVSEAEHHGVDVQFVLTPLDNTPEGQLIRFVRGYAAKVEHEKIKERTQRGRVARLRSGKLLHAPRPLYGRAWSEDGAVYVEDPLTAPVMRRMFQLFLDGASLRAIAQRLTDEGIPTPSGGQVWHRSTIRYLLTHEGYAGVARGWRMQDCKDKDGTLRRRVRPEAEQITLPEGTIPPLVSPEVFAAVKARLQRNQREALRNNGDPEAVLLRAGFVRCGHCGYAMRTWHNTKGYWVYRCDHDTSSTCPKGAYQGISAGKLDADVWGHISETLRHPELIASQLAELRRQDPTDVDLSAIDRSLAEVRRRQRNGIGNLLGLNPDTASLVRVELNNLTERERQLEGERTKVLERRGAWEAAQARIRDVEAWCRTVADRLGEATYQQKRDTLFALNVQVRVFRSDHEPRYTITCDLSGGTEIVSSSTSSTVHNLPPLTLRWTDRAALHPRC